MPVVALLLLMPTKIKPTCAIEEKARKRLMFCCRNANRFPTIMVITDNTISMLYHTACMGANTLYSVEMNTNAMAPLEITDKKEVTAKGEPSYTSAVHK